MLQVGAGKGAEQLPFYPPVTDLHFKDRSSYFLPPQLYWLVSLLTWFILFITSQEIQEQF